MLLRFVTSNTSKVEQAHKALLKFGISVEQWDADLVESRAEDPADIAREKAMQAFKLCNEPVIVEDSGFFIHALGGFPMTHVKFSLKTLGIENILKMMEGASDRSCSWRRSVAYATGPGECRVFTLVEAGELALEPREIKRPLMSDYWRLYIPKFMTTNAYALSDMPDDEFKNLLDYFAEHNHFTQLGEWLVNEKDATVSGKE